MQQTIGKENVGKSFAIRIVAARQKAGLTQLRAAEKWGFAYQTLVSWEQGVRNPAGFYRAKLEKVLSRIETNPGKKTAP